MIISDILFAFIAIFVYTNFNTMIFIIQWKITKYHSSIFSNIDDKVNLE